MSKIRPSIPEEFQSTKEELNAYFDQVIRYLAAINLAMQMYKEGIINISEYAECEKLMADKYGISDISIYRRRDPEDPCNPKNF